MSLRRTLSSSLAALLMVPSVFGIGCMATDIDASEDDINYRSTVGQEFLLSTTVTFKPSAEVLGATGEEKKLALAAQSEDVRVNALKAVVTELDRIWPEDERTQNGSPAIQFRQASATSGDAKLVGENYELEVSAEFSAVNDIERKLPLQSDAGKKYLPVPSTEDVSGNLRISLTPIERSLNAYPKVLELFQDGLDIAVHVGGDHNDPRQDLNHARSIFDDLRFSGFKSPVSRFEDLKAESGPFTRTIKVRGETVPVRVRLLHVEMTTPETRNVLIDAFKNSMKEADIVIYDGHAGRRVDYSGVVVAYSPARVALPAAQFKDVETSDKQQVYLFNGCETYNGYADELYKNPNRTTANTDIITTGNYSAIFRKASQVISFIHSFIDEGKRGYVPQSWDTILQKMNKDGERAWVHIYGVHGIDDNPKISPFADLSRSGADCRQDSDCGDADNRCVSVSFQKRVCAVACADTSGCPEGTRCAKPRSGGGSGSGDGMLCLTK